MDYSNLSLGDLIRTFDHRWTPNTLLCIAVNNQIVISKPATESEKIIFSGECRKYNIEVEYVGKNIIKLIPLWLQSRNAHETHEEPRDPDEYKSEENEKIT